MHACGLDKLRGAVQQRFHVYPALLAQALVLRHRYQAAARLHNSAQSQWLFELDMLEAMLAHPLRTHRPQSATVFVLPLLAKTSHLLAASEPVGAHMERMREALVAIQKEVVWSAGPHLLTCTCFMERDLFGSELYEMMQNRSGAILRQAHERRPAAFAPLQSIVPYHSHPVVSDGVGRYHCGWHRGTMALYMGSLETTRASSSCIRRHVAGLAGELPKLLEVHPTQRTSGVGCVHSRCISGNGVERDGRSGAKLWMASAMLNSTFCLVPEGDSPSSSRLFDAINALCVPVVITTRGVDVPKSRWWKAASIVVSEEAFVQASGTAFARLLQGQRMERRCDALRRLRDSLRAECFLERAVASAAQRIAAGVCRHGSCGRLRARYSIDKFKLEPLDDERLGFRQRSRCRGRRRLPAPGDQVTLRSGERPWVRAVLGDDEDSPLEVDYRDGRTSHEQIEAEDYVRCDAASPRPLPTMGDRVTLRTGERAWVRQVLGRGDDAALEVDFRDGRTAHERVGAEEYLSCGSRFL